VSNRRRIFTRLTAGQLAWVGDALRKETTGGALLLVAAVAALIWANTSPAAYNQFVHLTFGLTLSHWASDGLLAIFFFVAGMELKREFVEGSLKDRAVAAVPIAAAIGGMILPALIFTGINIGTSTVVGWGIPMATDIAFALAVLAVAGKGLPIELRAFLLTLAVVDDLGAILVIAIFYTASINLVALLAAICAIALFGFLQSKHISGWCFYLPLALIAWGSLYLSGIHATVAGVALGLLMNMKKIDTVMHKVHPISAGFAVPVFAFFSAGVSFGTLNFASLFASPVALGVIVGLVLGKPLGIVGTSWLVSRFTKASLAERLHWADIWAVGILAGVGFTVSLLINELAFSGKHETANIGTIAVLTASTISALAAVIVIQFRKRAQAND